MKWSVVLVFVKHAVTLVAGYAVALGILDPVTNTIHISSTHALYQALITIGISLLLSWTGLPGVTSAPAKAVATTPALATTVTPPPPDLIPPVTL